MTHCTSSRRLFSLGAALACSALQALATANYVYHERTGNDVTGGAPSTCGGAQAYVPVLDPDSSQACVLRFKVEYQFWTDQLRVYYTTDGSNPSGALGTPGGTTQVAAGSYQCTFTSGGNTLDVGTATIPAQPAGTVVKYIISAWHSGGGPEIFANSGTCGGCGDCETSACATLFQYTVGSTTSLYWDANGATPGAGGPTPVGVWGTSTFWSTVVDGTAATAAWTSGRTAVFSAGTDATGTYNVGVSGTQSATGVRFEEGTLLLTNGTVSLTAPAELNAASGITATIGSTLAGTAGYMKTGPGKVVLTNLANSVSGAIQVTGGILEITGSGRIGSTVAGSASVTLDGGTLRNTDTGNGNSFLSLNRSIVIGPSGGTVDAANSGVALIYNGAVTGPGNTLFKAGAGEFRALNNWTFSRLVVTQGLYRINGTGGGETGFGAVPASYQADAITISNGASIGQSLALTLNVNRGITLGAGGGGVNTASGTLTIPSVITGPGALLRSTSGTLALQAANTFTGGAQITAGRIDVQITNCLGTGPVIMTPASGVAMLANNSPAVVNVALGNSFSLNPGAGIIDISANSGRELLLTGKISGTSNWKKDNSAATGSLVLGNAANDFTGILTNVSGNVIATVNNALGSTSGLTIVSNNATLAFRGGVNYSAPEPVIITGPGRLGLGAVSGHDAGNTFAGTISLAADAGVGATNDADLTLTGIIADSGGARTLWKVGAGTVILKAANTYSGGTSVSNGVLLVNNTVGSGTGPGAVTNYGGTLGGTGNIAGTVTINSGAVLSPGGSIGKLTLGSSPVLNGTVLAEFNLTASPNADNLTVSAPLTYAGTLKLVNLGPAPTGGEVLDLFDAPGFNGGFATLDLPALAPGLNWWAGNLTVDGTVSVNRAPVGVGENLATGKAQPVSITAKKLLANDTDPDGQPLSIASVGDALPAGATVQLNSGVVTYTAPAAFDGVGSFTYTITDGRGGSVVVPVTVTVGAGNTVSLNITYGPVVSGGEFIVRFAGVPGYAYTVETSGTPTGPWVKLGNFTAPTTDTGLGVGIFEVRTPVETGPPAAQFFRTVSPAY